MFRPLPSPAAALAVLALLAGCRPADEIRTYSVPKDSIPNEPAAAAPAQPAQPSRMIAAMIEGDQQAWFFKAMGPAEQVDAVADEINAFLRTLRYDADASRPAWDVPQGWTEQPSSGMRLATLLVPAGDQTVELTVIGLALPDDWDAGVLDNVNRWRGQLGLDPISADQLDQIESLEVEGRKAAVVDLTGQAQASAMMPPMARGMPPMAGAAPRAATPPPAANPHGPQPKPVAYDLPDGWRELPPTGMRAVNARVGEGGAEAEVTAMAFPASAPDIASPLSNANRWLGENGMPPVDEAALGELTETIKVAEVDAVYFELLSTDHENNTLAALVPRGSMVWFFKLRGPAATVSANRDAFREWLSSMRFNVP